MSDAAAPAPPPGLRFEIEPPLARIVIDRDEKRNALSVPMLQAMRLFVERIAGDEAVRALVLCGEGRGFCAGEDVRGFDFPDVETAERFLHGPLDLFVALERLPKPVVVAVHGFAFGFGSEVLLVADSVFAEPGTRLGFAEIDHGLVPSVLVTRGLDVAFRRRVVDLALTGRRIGVEEALEARLVHEVVDDARAAAEAAAREMAEWAPASVALVKGLLGAGAADDHDHAREFMPPVLTQVAVSL
jgi:enoyl-CoA hydratase/carnithine racemase